MTHDGVVKTLNQLNSGAFARATWTNDSNGLARLNFDG